MPAPLRRPTRSPGTQRTRRPAARTRARGTGTSGNRTLYSLIGFAVVVLISLGLRMGTKSDDSQDVRRQMLSVIKQIDGYDEHRDYLIGVVERNHASVFDECYSMGGKRRSASFNADRYVEVMAKRLRAAALSDGKPQLAAAIGSP